MSAMGELHADILRRIDDAPSRFHLEACRAKLRRDGWWTPEFDARINDRAAFIFQEEDYDADPRSMSP